MINSIFGDKNNNYNAYRFYLIMLDIINFNYSSCIINKENNNLVKECLDKLLITIQNDIIEIINKSLYELVDLFYFKFLREFYVENEINYKYVINAIILMIEKVVKRIDEKQINRIIEINCKNILILLYKIIFFVNKRNLILLSENDIFLKNISLFLYKFIDNCNILFTKILFPIEEINPKNSKRKLLIEIVFEIIFEMHLDSIRNPSFQTLKVSEFLLKGLFDEKRMQTNLNGTIEHKKSSKNVNNEEIETYSPFYIMDKLSYFNIKNKTKDKVKINDNITINKRFYYLKDYLLSKYKDEYNEEQNQFSVCIIFSIKIILSMKELIDFYKTKSDNKNEIIDINELISKDAFYIELKNQFINLCRNILKIHKHHISINPFKSIGVHSNNLYEIFRAFIVDKRSFVKDDKNDKIKELINILNDNKKLIKIYGRVMYTKEGRTTIYNDKVDNKIPLKFSLLTKFVNF